ncbi:ClpB protein [Salmonella enterica subsp. enterica]|uniref:ClpB protein n=1 Tax=Salmonella enterica I TaxID=59201 RepID=A0A3S4HZN9_SALET|nr:ClpB protein [Salmonella enterica subsp. enterica]
MVWWIRWKKHHNVLILDEAVRAAVQLSHRYIPARQLPDKAISLLDTAAARVALTLHTPPASVQFLRQQLKAAENGTVAVAEAGKNGDSVR